MIKIFFLFVCFYFSLFSCTTLVVTKGASFDGSVIVAHTDDDELADQRIVFVPLQTYKKGAKRKVYPYPPNYPRYVGKERGPNYAMLKGYPKTKANGYIDQIKKTFAYIDANYGVLNEKQLAFGECTNSAKFIFKQSKDRIMQIGSLSKIAMERCEKAKDAVELMGSLAEKYGYYDWGETLLVADKNEAWVFEICSPPNGKKAMWVAKKVPDGEVFVAANEFRIREITPKDKDILYSKDLFKVAKKYKLYNPEKEKLDWLKIASPGEYDHPYYCLRRVWRLQKKINPNLKISAWVEDGYTKEYPFSIKPTKKLSVYDVMNLLRDHYQDTEFDLTKNMAAGPFGNPNRYMGPYDDKLDFPTLQKIEGAWERPISMYYCGFSYVTQLRDWLPDEIGGVTWVGLNTPETTCFVPFYAGVNNLPLSYQTGSTKTFCKDTAWWAFNFVSNWATLKFSYMIKDIKKMQMEIELLELKKQDEIEKKALKLYKKNPTLAKNFLTKYCINNANQVVNKWWQLSYYLIEKYSDGFINKPKIGKTVGYPKWWRDQVGFQKGPKSYKKPD